MAILITPAEEQEVTKLICRKCGQRVNGVGLAKNSKVEGLLFKCKKCGERNAVTTTEYDNKNVPRIH